MPAAPIVVSAVKTGPAPTNEQIVAALDSITQAQGHWIGQPRILYTRGTPPQVKFERTWQVTLDDPQGIVLSSFSVASLQAALAEALPGWDVQAARLAVPADMQQTAAGTIPVLIHTQATTALQAQAPRSADIQAGFERYSRSPSPENGHWVGPGPRIVRQAATGANRTFAAWLYEWPDTPWVRQNLVTLVEGLQWAVNMGLREETQRRGSLFNDVRLVPWDAVTASSWNEVVNGPLSWWRNGHATHDSRTTTEFPGIGSTEYVENPIGPDSAETHPQQADPFAGIASAAKVVGGITIGALGLWFIGPVVASWAKRRPAPTPRRNPIGPTRASMLRKGERIVWIPSSEAAAARFEGVLKIGASGILLERGVSDGGLLVRFDNGPTIHMPLRDLGIPSEMGYARPNPLISWWE